MASLNRAISYLNSKRSGKERMKETDVRQEIGDHHYITFGHSTVNDFI